MFKGYFINAAEVGAAIECLKFARVKIENRQNTYVCCALDDVQDEALVLGGGPACVNLKKAIAELLAPALTYSRHIGGASNPDATTDHEEYRAWLRKERVEWIDSMIEELQQLL